MLNAVLMVCFGLMLLSMLFASFRLYRGPGVVDRIIIFDLFTSIAVGLMAIASMWLESSLMLDVGLLASVVAFVGTIAFARYIHTREVKK